MDLLDSLASLAYLGVSRQWETPISKATINQGSGWKWGMALRLSSVLHTRAHTTHIHTIHTTIIKIYTCICVYKYVCTHIHISTHIFYDYVEKEKHSQAWLVLKWEEMDSVLFCLVWYPNTHNYRYSFTEYKLITNSPSKMLGTYHCELKQDQERW